MTETTITFTITATKIIHHGQCSQGLEKTMTNTIRMELEDHGFDELRIEAQRFELDKEATDNA